MHNSCHEFERLKALVQNESELMGQLKSKLPKYLAIFEESALSSISIIEKFQSNKVCY